MLFCAQVEQAATYLVTSSLMEGYEKPRIAGNPQSMSPVDDNGMQVWWNKQPAGVFPVGFHHPVFHLPGDHSHEAGILTR